MIKIMFNFVQNPREKVSYIVGREWGELRRTWEKYNKAKEDGNEEKISLYSKKIEKLQQRLGIKDVIQD